jgi:hypothetical protein
MTGTTGLRRAVTGLEQAARTLAEAIKANPDLRANASRDRDLLLLRDTAAAQ